MSTNWLAQGTSPSDSVSNILSTCTPSGPTTRASRSQLPRSGLHWSGIGLRSSDGPAVRDASTSRRRRRTFPHEESAAPCRVQPLEIHISQVMGRRREIPGGGAGDGTRMGLLDEDDDCCLSVEPQGARSTSVTWWVRARSPSASVSDTRAISTPGARATTLSHRPWRCSAREVDGRSASGIGPMWSGGRLAPGAYRGPEPGRDQGHGDRSARLQRRPRRTSP
jgi:hypothetical protein